MDSFTKELNKLGLKLSTDSERETSYSFFDTMTKYNIKYTKSKYDTCNTKFSNFVSNLTTDGITFDQYGLVIVPLLSMLNNGVVPKNPPISPTEMANLDYNMRDLIRLRNKTFYTGNVLDSRGFLSCNGEINEIINRNPDFKTDRKAYSAAAEGGKAGNTPGFLVEINKQLKETPTFPVKGNAEPVLGIAEKVLGISKKVPDNLEKAKQIKKVLFYSCVLLNKNQTNQRVKELTYKAPPIDYKTIVANLTHEEYAELKKENPQLNISSVMSRLYAKLLTQAVVNKTEENYQEYNSKLDMLNYLRIVPNLAFRQIHAEIRKAQLSGKNNYDTYNNATFGQYVAGLTPYCPETGKPGCSRVR